MTLTLAPVMPADIRRAAIELLSRREHSKRELRQKLQRKFDCSIDVVNRELIRLADENYQSDERFAEAFVVSRMRKGIGPQRLSLELKERGISPELVEAFVSRDSQEWLAIAVDVREKRFGSDLPSGKERTKQARFLQYRGFPSDIIRRLW